MAIYEYERNSPWAGFLVVGLLVSGLVGWVMNLLAVITAAKAGAAVTALLVLQTIGVVVPFLGAILGWVV